MSEFNLMQFSLNRKSTQEQPANSNLFQKVDTNISTFSTVTLKDKYTWKLLSISTLWLKNLNKAKKKRHEGHIAISTRYLEWFFFKMLPPNFSMTNLCLKQTSFLLRALTHNLKTWRWYSCMLWVISWKFLIMLKIP